MEDVFSSSRDGNVRFVRTWLEDTANDLNQGDDHGFTPLHWASREGQTGVFDTLLTRGARVSTVNHGGDTPLHLAASTNQKDIVRKLIKNKASVNAVNEHGNTPLHYACFWNFEDVAQELVKRGALVTQENKFGEIPLDKCKAYLNEVLKELATQLGHDLKRVKYKDNSKHFKYAGELRDIKNRYEWIDPKEINVIDRIGSLRGNSELWKGIWNGIAVVVKKLHVPNMNHRKNRDFNEEFPRLKIFSHPNVLPVLGAVNQPPTLMILSQYMLYGSLYNVLHEGAGILVDQSQAIKFAVDIARGAEYLHSLEPLIPRLYLTSTHIMIDEDLTARISMGDYRFSFLNHKKMFLPNWMAPEVLQKSPEEVDQRSADMWSFAILLWELTSREVPFADLSPMEIGMKVALEGLRPQIPPGVSTHMVKLINIAWNADPNKRPRFNQIMAILSKM